MKRILQFLSITLAVTSLSCATLEKEKKPEYAQMIAHIKSGTLRQYTGKEFTLEGYFVDRPVPMLLSSMRWLNINAPIPEREYIRLSGKGFQDLPPKRFYGAYIRIRGKVILSQGKEIDIARRKYGDVYAMEFTCPTPPIILDLPEKYIIPHLIPICKINPKLCEITTAVFPDKYAMLLSGGANPASAYLRYWNDLKFMYKTLKNQYGFTDDNIVVVYKNGIAEDNDMSVDYAANSNGVQNAFNYLQKKMTNNDLFVLFVTNHGGGFLMEETNAGNIGGRIDTSKDETDEAVFEEHLNTDLNGDNDSIDQVPFDERIYLYNSAQDLWDDDLAVYLNQLQYNKMLIILEQCFSGGFLADLRGENRVIVSAASEYEYSWAMAPLYNYDEFSYHFTAALANQTHDGTTVNADTNNDGKISALEAFNYAANNDNATENPYYEDSNDGRGHKGPFPQDGDGTFGATLTLE